MTPAVGRRTPVTARGPASPGWPTWDGPVPGADGVGPARPFRLPERPPTTAGAPSVLRPGAGAGRMRA
ncbi:hypothetical protein AB852_35250 [Streptomyces uncialis]|uniref:Uncharacterized protein n=1 Tax=Streptomyces uncialis TaxID=1048205 RepID=A0A1Q4UXV9_9ACTN|nr:hypothetical protein AB852_35250 [Streptomyces uncialis]